MHSRDSMSSTIGNFGETEALPSKKRVSFADNLPLSPLNIQDTSKSSKLSRFSYDQLAKSPSKRRFSITSLGSSEISVDSRDDEGLANPPRKRQSLRPPPLRLNRPSEIENIYPDFIISASPPPVQFVVTRSDYQIERNGSEHFSESPVSPHKGLYSTPTSNDSVLTCHSPTSSAQSDLDDWTEASISVPSDSPIQSLCTILPSPDSLPPAQICDVVNRRIRSAFGDQGFDFAEHISHRSYVVRPLPLETGGCVVMLDAAVEKLIPTKFPALGKTLIDRFADLRPSAGKGLGLFAKRNMAANQTILVEYPTIVTPYVVGLAVPLAELYKDMFQRLSPEVFEEVMALSAVTGYEGVQDVFEAVVKVNALGIQLQVPDGEFAELETHRAIFLTTSRCNHSCGPNARWDWNEEIFTLTLTAVRDIAVNEEITIPYIAPDMLFEARQEVLLSTYGFQCLCDFCVSPKDVIQQSDDARRMLHDLWEPRRLIDPKRYPTFKEWFEDTRLDELLLIDVHRRALELIYREGLESIDLGLEPHAGRDIGRHIDVILRCYGALGETEEFKSWVAKAVSVRPEALPMEILAFKMWLSNPLSFPLWEKRGHRDWLADFYMGKHL